MLLESLRQQVLRANQEDRPPRPRPAHLRQRQRHRPFRSPSLSSSSSPAESTTPRLSRKTWSSPISTARSSKARFALPAISTPTPCFTASSRRSAASSTPTPSSPPPGPRPAGPFPASAPPTPTTFTARSRSPKPLPPRKSPPAYVRNTGAVIVRRFRAENLDPVAVPGVLVAGHAPFAWGKTPAEAVEHADVLEYIARLAFRSILLGARRKSRFRPTSANITTCASTARRPPTARDNVRQLISSLRALRFGVYKALARKQNRAPNQRY